MRIYLNGQDINRLVIADLDAKADPLVMEINPEGYLKMIDKFLSDRKLTNQDLKEIYVVIGPGSATALRAIITIVNTLKLVNEVKLFGIEKPTNEHDIDTVTAIVNKKVVLKEIDDFLNPKYGQGPKITLSTKDRLGREKVIE